MTGQERESEMLEANEIGEVDFPLEVFELVLFRTNETAPVRAAGELKRINAEHIAYASSQLAAGNAVLAGAITEHARYNGVGLFCTGSMDRVREILDRDPVITGGVDTYEVMHFVTRKGVLQRRPAVAPTAAIV